MLGLKGSDIIPAQGDYKAGSFKLSDIRLFPHKQTTRKGVDASVKGQWEKAEGERREETKKSRRATTAYILSGIKAAFSAKEIIYLRNLSLSLSLG